MPRNNQSNRSGSKNSNPQGRNQYSNGMMDMARERPVATAAAAAAAVGAGVFLWSRRSQISDQLANLSDQIGEWTENMSSDRGREFETAGGEPSFSGSTGAGTAGEFTGGSRSTGGKGSTTRSGRTSTGSSTTGRRSTGSSSSSSTGSSSTGSRNAGGSVSGGSGTMSGGSLDTGPSGRTPA